MGELILQWASIANIVFVVLAACVTFLIYYLNAAKDRKPLQRANMVLVVLVASTAFLIYYLNTGKDHELEKYRAESTMKITAAQAEAVKAMKFAESERLARAELESQAAGTNAHASEANTAASQAQLELAKLNGSQDPSARGFGRNDHCRTEVSSQDKISASLCFEARTRWHFF